MNSSSIVYSYNTWCYVFKTLRAPVLVKPFKGFYSRHHFLSHNNKQKCFQIFLFQWMHLVFFTPTKCFNFYQAYTFPWDMWNISQTIGPNRFSRFDVYWIQTDKYSSLDKITIQLWIFSLCLHFKTKTNKKRCGFH